LQHLIFIFMILVLSACSRTPEYKAPEGEAGGCGSLYYRYDTGHLTLLKLDLGDRALQGNQTSLVLNVPEDKVDAELLVFAKATPDYFCHGQTPQQTPKAVWKLLSGKITVKTTGACVTPASCNTSVVLEDGQFGMEFEGQLLKFNIESVSIDRVVEGAK